MKVEIDYEEWMPVYFLTEAGHAPEFEVPEEQAERWRKVFAEFSEVQKEMESIHGKWNE